MRKERLNEEEVLGVVRAKKFSSMQEVEAMVFESNSNISVIRKSESDKNLSYEPLLSSVQNKK